MLPESVKVPPLADIALPTSVTVCPVLPESVNVAPLPVIPDNQFPVKYSSPCMRSFVLASETNYVVVGVKPVVYLAVSEIRYSFK